MDSGNFLDPGAGYSNPSKKLGSLESTTKGPGDFRSAIFSCDPSEIISVNVLGYFTICCLYCLYLAQ